VNVLGVPVDALDMKTAVEFASRALQQAAKPACILAVNPEKVMTLQKDRWLRDFFTDVDLLIPDGIGVVWAAKMLHRVAMSRVPGADLMPELCRLATESGHRVFLFGAKEEVNAAAARNLQEMLPTLRIAGRAHGYWPKDKADDLVDQINGSGADILFVALGSPRQERWIAENQSKLTVRVIQGVGGTFDVISGVVKRAPEFWQRIHLEWFYRLLSDPRRIKRQAVYPAFVLKVLADKIRGVA